MRPADPEDRRGALTSNLARGVRHLTRSGRSFHARGHVVKAERFSLLKFESLQLSDQQVTLLLRSSLR